MKLPSRLIFCLKLVVFLIPVLGVASAQITVRTVASPSGVGEPLVITATCGGPHIAHINFYAGTSPSNVYSGSPIAQNIPTAPGSASYTWRPTQPGTYYLGATAAETQYCGSNPAPPVAQLIATAPSYFGFYDSNSPGAGSGFTDETPAISGFANTTWIGCSSPSACTTSLQEAQKYNMHAVVALAGPALPAPGSSSTAVQTWLTSWKSYWQSYTSAFSPYVANGTLVAFYPYDEPIGGEWSAGNLASDTTSYLNSVASVIKQTFPATKVAMVFTGANTFTYLAHGQNVIPSSYDWIGIDIYECWTGVPRRKQDFI
jgi:hypothetical protein